MLCHGSQTKKSAGFTLLELMVVVAIVAILAAIAWPTYTDQVRKARRSDGKGALQELATRLEQFYLDNKTYTTSMANLGYTDLDGAGKANSSERWYKVSVSAATVACPIATCYQVIAEPQNDQSKDTKCANLMFTSKQERKVSGTFSSDPSKCW